MLPSQDKEGDFIFTNKLASEIGCTLGGKKWGDPEEKGAQGPEVLQSPAEAVEKPNIGTAFLWRFSPPSSNITL